MALSVLNNVASLAAQNQLSITNLNLQKALFQLSSGSRINTGADDAAGLAIADGLHANITALTQSARNANDGVGELQVADGSLAQVTTLLNRAITLATEAATGTVSDPQRIALDDEYTAIKNEVDRIGAKTNYNGAAVFNAGSLDVFLSDGNASSNSTIGIATGLLSSAGLGLGGPTPAIATLTQSGFAAPARAVLSGAASSAPVAATGTLTQTSSAATPATATLTFTAQPTAADTVTVGATTYTFVTALNGTPTANEVLLGADQAASQANLVAAVSLAAGSGTTYGSPTVINASATAAVAGSTVVFTAKTGGTAGNSIVSTEAGTNTSFGAATFAGGAAGTPAVPSSGDTVSVGGTTYTFRTSLTASTTANEVLIGANEAAALTNLANAVNGGTGSGTTYGSATVTNANVTAVAGATSVAFTATGTGSGGNAITTTTTGNAGTFGGATLSGGAATGATPNAAAGNTITVGTKTYTFVASLSGAGSPNQVVVGASEALSLLNLAAAVNGSAGAGTTYGAGTIANPSATATANSNSVTFTAITAGIGGNSLVSTVTGTANTFAAATFANGADASTPGVATAGDTVTVGTTTYSFVGALTGAPNQVLVGATNAASLAHLTAAVNASSGAGSTFGVGTVANTVASARATGSSVIFTALQSGTPGNALVSTSSGSGGNTFGGSTFAGGSVGTPNDLLNIPDATAALATISASIQTVAALRGTIGATVNRLQSAANVINNQVQNLTGAEDGVRAADIPTTIATLAKYSILEQTGISALAQANQQQQLVLKLLQ